VNFSDDFAHLTQVTIITGTENIFEQFGEHTIYSINKQKKLGFSKSLRQTSLVYGVNGGYCVCRWLDRLFDHF
ncbi:MAG: hypothetical protein ACI8YX_000525, partial [Porticoccaceae bacterium]